MCIVDFTVPRPPPQSHCVAIDVLANTEVIQNCKDNDEQQQLVTEFVLQAISQKHKWQLDGGANVKFPKIKYKGAGAPQLQRIRVTKRSQITEEGGTAAAPLQHGSMGSQGGAGAGGNTTEVLDIPDFEVRYMKTAVFLRKRFQCDMYSVGVKSCEGGGGGGTRGGGGVGEIM